MLIDWFKEILIPYAHSFPLPPLAFGAAFFEELIPPIPGFTLMIMIGSFARIQDYQLLALFSLTLFTASGKTLGATIVYHIVDRLEDVFFSKFGPLFKIKPEQVEAFGKKLGHGMIDYAILIFLRALPIIPSTLVTIGSGLIRVPKRLFIISTFIGSTIRDSIYLYTGYVGTIAFEKYFHSLGKLQTLIVFFIILLIIVITYYRSHKTKDLKTTSE